MTNHIACDELQAAWDAVSTRWSAEAKSKYFNLIYLPLLEEADGNYKRNEDLEDYAESCIDYLHIQGGN